MPTYRFYTDSALEKSKVVLTGSEFCHLSRVMRAKIGDSVEIVDGQGKLAQAVIEALEKERAILHIASIHTEKKRTEIILAQALPHMNHLEWIVEKGTELDASSFWLFPGELSEKKVLSDHQKERLHTLAISAMKQCGRLFLPPLIFKPPLSQWDPIPGSLFYGDTRKNAPKLSISGFEEPFVIFIGPEKGFSPKEVELLQHKLKALGVKLHENILRTETAGVVALAQVFRIFD